MTYSSCDGSFVSEEAAAYYDRVAHQYRSFPGYYNPSPETRAADYRRQRKADEEQRLLAALLTMASRCGDVETATLPGDRAVRDAGDPDQAEALRIAREHGWDDMRLVAFRGLAASRGLPLADVLRSAMKGELLQIVELPPVPREDPDGAT